MRSPDIMVGFGLLVNSTRYKFVTILLNGHFICLFAFVLQEMIACQTVLHVYDFVVFGNIGTRDDFNKLNHHSPPQLKDSLW